MLSKPFWRRGNLPRLDDRFAFAGDVQERMLADDRIVALEDVLRVGIKDVSFDVGIIVQQRMAFVVAIPIRETAAPTIFQRNEIARLLVLARQHARPTRVAQRRIEREAKQFIRLLQIHLLQIRGCRL